MLFSRIFFLHLCEGVLVILSGVTAYPKYTTRIVPYYHPLFGRFSTQIKVFDLSHTQLPGSLFRRG
ncbi:hypothetical protein JI435_411260 [Parastagonospora nodorum SN15]|uniref:Secreted protein n=1 Tax=Phaeosphaeria nodorum (strain SN15 / ATCC MYA-4574 / FGSC 10173) TaxID=321614 RepID=A0A7U2F5E3_PHANO|nr:hypothetical protein JI435_411260 [Parastagonospora nodorum SN15]